MIDEVYLHQSAQDNAMKLAAAIEEKPEVVFLILVKHFQSIK